MPITFSVSEVEVERFNDIALPVMDQRDQLGLLTAVNQCYKHSPLIHRIGIGGPLFLSWLAYRSSIDRFVHGGMMLRVILVVGCVALAVAIGALYVTSGANRYEFTESGLRIRRFFGLTFHPWAEVHRLAWNHWLHYVVIYGRHGRIAYTSTDLFPAIVDFLYSIHRESGCELDPKLARVLAAYEGNGTT